MQRAVVVTGAATGIGHATAMRLARAGFQVFAGVRKAEDAERLEREGEGKIRGLLLEVTDASSIDAAFRTVSDALGGDGLYAIVNNAGVGGNGPLEFMSLDEMRRVYEVNVFGLVAVTQAFLPLIRRARGRVVNIGSIGDRFTLPFGGPLCSSKAAVRSLNDTLRLELHPFGVHVSLIQPTSIATPAVKKFEDEAAAHLASLPTEASQLYGQMFAKFMQRATAEEAKGSPPEVVADGVLRALTDARPQTRYVVGKQATLMSLLPFLPDRAFDFVRLALFGLPLAFGAAAVYKASKEKAAR